MRLASGNVKKISLELGGKSPNIVFADADLEKFARESPYSVFDNCGQDCCARSRILVERSAHDQVVELFADATRAVKVGPPSDEATEVGTLVSFKQRDRVKDYIEIGLGEGATVVVGGEPPTDAALADGAYLMPTVFDNVSNDMRIAREEIFGPVVSVIAFDTEEEALRLANATPYGLSGSIWSRDIGKALRAAKALQAGVISVNSNSSVHTEAPFGGYKMSGIGRELGMSALELYTETKNVFIDLTADAGGRPFAGSRASTPRVHEVRGCVRNADRRGCPARPDSVELQTTKAPARGRRCRHKPRQPGHRGPGSTGRATA